MHIKPSVEITIPVYNEEVELNENINKLLSFCTHELKEYEFNITIADNASTDKTPEIGRKLAQQSNNVQYVRFSEKGRGRAVKKIWKASQADISAYMDIDLSTDLKHLPRLVTMLVMGEYDIGIGSRLLKDSKVINRTIKRELMSRIYNFMIKIFFQTRFSDAQCGFKAVTRKTVKNLLPHVLDNEWFMDSELLILGEKMGYRIYEEPVRWQDNPGSTVRVLPTAMGDIHGLLRLFLTRPWKNSNAHDRHS